MRVFVFKGTSSTYGLTPNDDASILPSEHGPWVPFNELDMQRGEPPRIAINTDEALNNIEAHGFHLQGVQIISTESVKPRA